MAKQVVAFFSKEQQAEEALGQLTASGFDREEISVLTRQDVADNQNNEGQRDGMTTGGVIGAATGLIMGLSAFAAPGVGLLAAAGPVASLLAGAAAGGIIGSLADLGFSESDTQLYIKELEKGSVFLSVDTEQKEEAKEILQKAGAYRVDLR
ncbi:MAG: general stress protein [Clostridia bacterium]|nr:general stress protein [Clostridia bacterium]